MRLTRVLSILASTLAFGSLLGQEPVRWSMTCNEADGRHMVLVTATMENGWHIYDRIPSDDFGPTPTTISFSVEGGRTEGETTDLTPSTRVFEPAFGFEIGYYEKTARFEQEIVPESPSCIVRARVEYMACQEGSCTPPTETELECTIGATTEAGTSEVKDAAGGGPLWTLVLEAVIWGFVALLTPCVFPMVPMTVSFFMRSAGDVHKGRIAAGLYGAFIVLLYTLPVALIIILTRIIGGDAVTADIFNFLATHWIPNVIFFVVFMAFAASFFGAFEFKLPSWMINGSDRNAERSGWVGIFFMALTLVLVSFSCTGPIVGSVLIKSTSGQFWSPIITMAAFSVAFALPFTLLALFPSFMQRMPRSGDWLNSVKVTLGFVEIALGFKFISVADQVYHWGILNRELYLAIWIAAFTLLALYYFKVLRIGHEAKGMPGKGRIAMGCLTLLFVAYLLPGMWGAPLRALSGYLPPISTQTWFSGKYAAHRSAGEQNGIKYGDKLRLPDGLKGFFDMDEAIEYARINDKPIFIDFTGHGCVNCREMESRVWSDPRVREMLTNRYVIVALYTDDKMEVEQSEWVTTESGKTLKTLGKINAHYALTRFGVNAQPFYVLQDCDGRLLAEPRGYDLDVESFVSWLQSGIEAFGK